MNPETLLTTINDNVQKGIDAIESADKENDTKIHLMYLSYKEGQENINAAATGKVEELTKILLAAADNNKTIATVIMATASTMFSEDRKLFNAVKKHVQKQKK